MPAPTSTLWVDELPSTTLVGIGSNDYYLVSRNDGGTRSANRLPASEIANALAGKQATITGAATSIVSSDLTASRALVSDGSGKVAVSSVTSTELSYSAGVTSAIQTQLNAKVDDGAVTTSGLTMATARLLGRSTAATGAIEEIAVGSGLSLTGGTLTATSSGGGKVLQVVQYTALGTQAITDATPQVVLSGTITPSSASSRILILVSAYVGNQTTTTAWTNILRNGTAIFRGNAEGTRTRAITGQYSTSNDAATCFAAHYVDSPATTSSTTYALALSRDAATGTVYLNRTHTNTDAVTYGRGAASLILLEIGP
jgi:hypothetical protein